MTNEKPVDEYKGKTKAELIAMISIMERCATTDRRELRKLREEAGGLNTEKKLAIGEARTVQSEMRHMSKHNISLQNRIHRLEGYIENFKDLMPGDLSDRIEVSRNATDNHYVKEARF